jgi:hypothetical protein
LIRCCRRRDCRRIGLRSGSRRRRHRVLRRGTSSRWHGRIRRSGLSRSGCRCRHARRRGRRSRLCSRGRRRRPGSRGGRLLRSNSAGDHERLVDERCGCIRIGIWCRRGRVASGLVTLRLGGPGGCLRRGPRRRLRGREERGEGRVGRRPGWLGRRPDGSRVSRRWRGWGKRRAH